MWLVLLISLSKDLSIEWCQIEGQRSILSSVIHDSALDGKKACSP